MSAFVIAMNAMREHQKSGSTEPFPIQQHIAAIHGASGLLGAAAPADDPALLDQLHAQFKSDTAASAQVQQTGVTTAAQTLQSSAKDTGAANDFTAKMTAQRDKAKADAAASIDKVYDAAINLGSQPGATPAQQSAIMNGMGFVSNTVTQVFSTIASVVSGIMNKIGDILSGIFNAIDDVVNAFAPVASILSIF